MPPSTLRIKLGESGTQFLQRNHLDSRGNVDWQPAGLNFHEHDWSTDHPGTVIVDHGAHSFEIKHALGVVGTESAKKQEKGLYSFSVTAGITAADYVLHDKARIAFISRLQTLAQAGWKPAIPYGAPRLSGEQAFKYYREENSSVPSVNYAPTLDEWMRIKSGSWRFYAGDLFMNIAVRRGGCQVVDEPGAYLLSFSLYGKEERDRKQVRPSERDQWKTLWVDVVKKIEKTAMP